MKNIKWTRGRRNRNIGLFGVSVILLIKKSKRITKQAIETIRKDITKIMKLEKCKGKVIMTINANKDIRSKGILGRQGGGIGKIQTTGKNVVEGEKALMIKVLNNNPSNEIKILKVIKVLKRKYRILKS